MRAVYRMKELAPEFALREGRRQHSLTSRRIRPNVKSKRAMSTSFFTDTKDATEAAMEAHPYRTMSRMAMMSLIFGLLSVLGFLAPVLSVFGFFGLICCLLAVRNLRRYPDELSGRPVALAGGALSMLLMSGAIGYHSYVYATEVPDGYERISFRVLQPKADADPSSPVPDTAKDLDGKQVFVSGYIHPDAGMSPVQSFVLVPDMGTCCFGGQPKLTDMIEVTLPDEKRVRYSTRKRKLTGTLKVDSRLKPLDGLQGVYYQLEVDEVIR